MNLTFKLLRICILLLLTSNLFAQTPISITESYVRASAEDKEQSEMDIAGYRITNTHVSKRSKVTHTYIQQQYKGIPIYGAVMGIHVLENNELLILDNQFLKEIATKTNTESPLLTVEQALQAVVEQMNYRPTGGFSIVENIGGITQENFWSPSGISRQDIRAYLTYQPVGEALHLCWNLTILEMDKQNWWDMRVDATTGKILHKDNWMLTCNFDHAEGETCEHETTKATEDLPLPMPTSSVAHEMRSQNASNPDSYRVYAEPLESPNHGASTLTINPADPVASPFGWHDTDGVAGAEFTITRGNNVAAWEDHDGNNGVGYSPDGGASLDFDFAIDFNQAPCDAPFKDAALTNLFYWNNLMHDVWYQYGFDEASGNFQENNYGNGGVGSDFVVADGQDGSGTNNANFGTPADGGNPQMQMFLWGAGITTSATNDFTVNSPASIAAAYGFVPCAFGAASFDMTGDLVIVDDGTATPASGCDPLTNGAAINGNIALIDRGTCQFGVKALHAQNAGAVAVVICQNTGDAPFAGSGGTDGGSVTIPVVMISQADCTTIRAEIPTVNLHLQSETTITGCSGRDGDLDNGIVAHEYGHGISTRLTGGAGNSGCLNTTEQMGEGWSDWFGLMLTIEPGDQGTDGRGIGTFAQGQGVNGGGIRPFRYSTDLGVNPHSYADISSVSIPHGVGSVWCAMLWELTWGLIDEYGYDADLHNGIGGNNIAMALVTEGLKLQPCSPGFVDGRDAILAADMALYGGANQCIIWAAFAKRGLGFKADQGSPNNLSDSVESFNPNPFEYTVVSNTAEIAPGGQAQYTLTVTNNSCNTFTSASLVNPIPNNTTYVANSASDNGVLQNGEITWTGLSIAPGETITRTFSILLDASFDNTPYAVQDDIESGAALWTTTASNNSDFWTLDASNPAGGTMAWFVQDIPSSNDAGLVLIDSLAPLSTTSLTFDHYFNTEINWDGGIVQYSTDGGNNWMKIPNSSFTQNGYNGILDNNGNNLGFSGISGGGETAAYITSIIDLSILEGSVVKIRFLMHCDQAEGGEGWYIDNVVINNIGHRLPNTALFNSTETGTCVESVSNPALIIDAPACAVSESYTGTVLSGTYTVANTISSTGVVPNGSTVVFDANCIELNEEFEVELGADFLAQINPCVALTGNTNALQSENDLIFTQNTVTKQGFLTYTNTDKEDITVIARAIDTGKESVLLTQKDRTLGTQTLQFDISKVEKGTYFFIIQNKSRELAKKVVLN